MPSNNPTIKPSYFPSVEPSQTPSEKPSVSPTIAPTSPTISPTDLPSAQPSTVGPTPQPETCSPSGFGTSNDECWDWRFTCESCCYNNKDQFGLRSCWTRMFKKDLCCGVNVTDSSATSISSNSIDSSLTEGEDETANISTDVGFRRKRRAIFATGEEARFSTQKIDFRKKEDNENLTNTINLFLSLQKILEAVRLKQMYIEIPASIDLMQILNILEQQGYIKEYKMGDHNKNEENVKIQFKFNENYSTENKDLLKFEIKSTRSLIFTDKWEIKYSSANRDLIWKQLQDLKQYILEKNKIKQIHLIFGTKYGFLHEDVFWKQKHEGKLLGWFY